MSLLPHRRFALLVAGGTGTRMGGPVAKQFLMLAGKPVIAHTFARFHISFPDIRFCLVLHPSLFEEWEALRAEYLPWLDAHKLILAPGGNERSDSVSNGLEAIAAAVENPATVSVAIHDAVRPLIRESVIRESFAQCEKEGNSVVCVPVKSSMRMKTETGSVAVDRSLFYHVQTPQTFMLNGILECYRKRPHNRFTDDASLAEHFGVSIHICEGDYDNIKITTPEDLAVAEKILG